MSEEITYQDIDALHKLLPPKQGEELRTWMLRCLDLGLITAAEARFVKRNNERAWCKPYVTSAN